MHPLFPTASNIATSVMQANPKIIEKRVAIIFNQPQTFGLIEDDLFDVHRFDVDMEMFASPSHVHCEQLFPGRCAIVLDALLAFAEALPHALVAADIAEAQTGQRQLEERPRVQPLAHLQQHLSRQLH